MSQKIQKRKVQSFADVTFESLYKLKISKFYEKIIFSPSERVRVGCERNGKEAVVYMTKMGLFPDLDNSEIFGDDLISSPIRHTGIVEYLTNHI